MNIQFRRIHLPPLPTVNAQALVKLAGKEQNTGLKTPFLSVDIPKKQTVSRSNLDEIIRDIESGQIEKITILEWIHCLYNKEKWDIKHPNRIKPTSEAIWKAAGNNSWLKQKLFWNLVLDLSGRNVLASSLAKSYSIFSPQDSIDRKRLAIIKAFQAQNPKVQLIELCWQELLTPRELFFQHQLPSKIPIIEKCLTVVVSQFSQITSRNDEQIDWLLRCFEEMNQEQQVKAVEYLLIESDPKLGAERPELINWLHQHYGSSLPNSRWSELSSEAKAAMRKWIGAVSYQDFQKLVSLILERLHLQDFEHNRLRSRSKFWSNYSDHFERIRILLPESSVNILGNYLSNQDISILLNDGSDPTEVCIFDFGDWFVIEFFRGDGSETSIIRKDPEIEQKLFHSQLSVKRLRCLDRNIHDHEFCWQYFCEQLLRTKNIFPNENIQYFKGLSDRHRRYNRQTGLPKPSPQNLQKRRYKVERWQQKMVWLEREAKEYCQRHCL
ncbi:MAG: EH signature domain-containing protein [Xenococcaceae cyanobacterium MO_188.B29]|nr:EH signature domain-containing protein [Xenococcaceae cyanobacterium MO_188.B29]